MFLDEYGDVDALDRQLLRENEAKKRQVATKYAPLGLNPDHYETADQMEQDAQGRLANLKPAKSRQQMFDNGEAVDLPNAQEGTKRSIRRPFAMQAYSGANPVQQDFIDQFGPAAQARHLGGMISDVMGAYQDENDSRVAQARERARMDHETQLAAMAQDALIQRLQMEAEEQRRDRILQDRLASGVTNRQFVNGQWEDV